MKKFLALVVATQVMILTGCASTPTRTRAVYVQPSPQRTYARSQPAPQEDYNRKIIKQGLLGAATGAIAAETSGGKAGTGALVGAGTNIIGGALFDVLTTPPAQPQPVPYVTQQSPNDHRTVRKYASNGNIISEEVYTR